MLIHIVSKFAVKKKSFKRSDNDNPKLLQYRRREQ